MCLSAADAPADDDDDDDVLWKVYDAANRSFPPVPWEFSFLIFLMRKFPRNVVFSNVYLTFIGGQVNDLCGSLAFQAG